MTAPTQLTARFEQALVYAARLHRHQYRKDDRPPYIAHLLSVAAIVLEQGGDEDEAIAALLHDAVEDQGGEPTRQAIQQQFGDRVTAIVEGCTEPIQTPKLPWQLRKRRYLEQLQQASVSVLRVSLADKLHNARSLLASLHQEGNVIWSRFNASKAEKLEFYRALNQIYRSTDWQDLTEELDRLLAEIAAFSPDP